jgi:hypothetical protein
VAEKRFRTSWFVGGGVVVLVLVGLFVDVWRSYAVKKSLEIDVRAVTESAAKYLPFRPQEAVAAAMRGLEERGIDPDQGSVTVDQDGYGMKVSVISDVTAYFAWMVGSPRMKFQAEAHAVVTLEGGGPADEVLASDVAFAMASYADFKVGQNVVISPAGDTAVPDYALKAYAVERPELLRVGDTATVRPLESLKNYASPKTHVVVILAEVSENRGRILGFAALDGGGVDDQGRVLGRFIRSKIAGDLKRSLPQENDFGLVKGGEPKVEVR